MYSTHLKLAAVGDFYANGISLDGWSWGLSLVQNNLPEQTSTPDATQTDALVAAVRAFHTDAATRQAASQRLHTVKCNLIGADGKYVFPDSNERVLAPPAVGASSHAGTPLSTALKITLDDGSRSRRRKGGFYVPFIAQGVGADGRYAQLVADDMARAVETLINNIQTAGYTVVIASKYGDIAPVTRIRVGTAPDTQRRRDNALLESYSEVWSDPAPTFGGYGGGGTW